MHRRSAAPARSRPQSRSFDDEINFGDPAAPTDSPSDVADAARGYLARGQRPIPIPAGTKAPSLKGWPDLRLVEADLPRYFPAANINIGILLGAPSDNLIDVDLDCPETVALAPTFLPNTGSRFGRASKRGSHWLYLCELPTEKYRDVDDKTMLVEIRGTGQQTVVPPSVHPTGERIEWELNGEAAPVAADDLRRAVTALAITALLARHWPKTNGSRDDIAMAAAGLLLRAGLPEDLVDRITESAARVAGDKDSKDRRKAKGTDEALAAGKEVTGGPRLAELLTGDGPKVVDRLRQWLSSLTPTAAPNDWPTPLPLPNALLSVPAFSMDLLPTAFAPWVSDIAERTQCPADFVAMGAVVSAASVVGRQIAIRPKRQDDWTVVANLWGAAIGRPGIMKSPALDEATRLLERLRAEALEAFKVKQQGNAFNQAKAKAHRELLQAQIKAALKNGEDVEALRGKFEALREAEPAERRYVVNDCTVEKLGELLNENPNGLLLQRDELSGLLAMMDREGHENDRAFFCESWNGTGEYTYDRIARGTVHIKAACLSILGGIQPGPLQAYLQDVFGRGATDDGLVQRFQLMVYPDITADWQNVDRWPDTEAKTTVFEIFRKLAELDIVLLGAQQGDGLPFLRFSAEAQQVFDAWRTDLERQLRAGADHPVIISHLAKYRSLMPALALLFHVIDCVDQRTGGPVSEQAARRAVAWCPYLEAHARRVYQSLTAASATAAAALAAKLRAGEVQSPFRVRTVRLKGWAGLTDGETIELGLDLLEELH